MIKSEWISALGSLISAIFAGLALISAIWIYKQTRNILKPHERPVIATTGSECTGELIKDNKTLKINFNLKFKNVGQNPAENCRLRVWAAPLDDPNKLTKYFDETIANKIYPQTDFAFNTITINWSLPAECIPQKDRTLKFPDDRPKVFLYFVIDYDDSFTFKKCPPEELYIVYTLAKRSAGHASTQQKEHFKPYIDKQLSQ
jgi:hypothetical protein